MTDGCWTCHFQKTGGHQTALGWCVWFEAHGQPRKAIPPAVVDVGCKQFVHAPTRYWATHTLNEDTDGAM